MTRVLNLLALETSVAHIIKQKPLVSFSFRKWVCFCSPCLPPAVLLTIPLASAHLSCTVSSNPWFKGWREATPIVLISYSQIGRDIVGIFTKTLDYPIVSYIVAAHFWFFILILKSWFTWLLRHTKTNYKHFFVRTIFSQQHLNWD